MKLITHQTYAGRTPSKQERLSNPNLGDPFTIVIDELPSYDGLVMRALKLSARGSRELPVMAGYAVTHPSDQFSRKTGLAIATNKNPCFEVDGRTIGARFQREFLNIESIAVEGKNRALLTVSLYGRCFSITYTRGGPKLNMVEAIRALSALSEARRIRK